MRLPDFYNIVNFFLNIFKIGVGSAYEQVTIIPTTSKKSKKILCLCKGTLINKTYCIKKLSHTFHQTQIHTHFFYSLIHHLSDHCSQHKHHNHTMNNRKVKSHFNLSSTRSSEHKVDLSVIVLMEIFELLHKVFYQARLPRLDFHLAGVRVVIHSVYLQEGGLGLWVRPSDV